MAEIIQQIFCDPPMAIARLGGSTTPQVAYSWGQPPNPRTEGETVITPDWSLDVLTDGSVNPFLPDTIRLRDGNLIRPVCPFVEVWVRLGEPNSEPATWRDAPLTPELLARFGASEAALSFEVDARNLKAARRMTNPALAFGTFPKLVIAGTTHDPVPIDAVSPRNAPQRMIPAGRFIRLGALQVMRSRPQPPADARPWPDYVRVDVIRFRFTPAAGLAYGPPQAAQPTNASPVPAVRSENAFLNANAGWFNVDGQSNRFVQPGDTFDQVRNGSRQSLGVVDDTCEARIDVVLTLSGRTLRAHANVFSGPPDYAPDRRPFLSLADELNDRSSDSATRSAALSGAELDLWVQDLFERAYETVSLMNVDFWRNQMGLENMAQARLRAALPNDGVSPVTQAMGSRDRLRNPDLRVPAPNADEALPLSQHARARHRAIADVQTLRDFVRQNPDRLRALIRGPFENEVAERDGSDFLATTMRMPPFMRHSNAAPLTLAAWQYDLLMRWVQQILVTPVMPTEAFTPTAAPPPDSLAARAAARRDAVLRRLS